MVRFLLPVFTVTNNDEAGGQFMKTGRYLTVD